MPVFDIYLCAFRRCGSYYNGSHRSSNGFVYTYTEIDKTILYLSIPFPILNNAIVKELKEFFSDCVNKEITYTDWENESTGVRESEVDISGLIKLLNINYHHAYTQYIFKQGNRELCPFEAGDYSLIPLEREDEDLR